MPYVTSFERVGEVRGEARGRASMVLSLLSEVCGSVPEEYERRVRELPSEDLQRLGKAPLRFQSLADLQNWFQQHSPASETSQSSVG